MGGMRLAILGLAVVAAGLAAFLVQRMNAQAPAPVQQEARMAAPSLTQVLVAANDIELGAALSAKDLRWQDWPEGATTGAFITREDRPEARSELKSSITRVAMAAGEPVLVSKLVSDREGGFMAALLEPGRRAMAVEISEETAVSGFVLPNDRVDVILARQASGGEGGSGGYVSETVLENVRILAIDQNYEQKEGKQVVVGETATLEVMPHQAERLAFAIQAGDVALVLRSLSDTAPGEEAVERDANRRINVQLIRYGLSRTVSVKTGQ